jgi:DNA-directed RNA polymerase subunit A"
VEVEGNTVMISVKKGRLHLVDEIKESLEKHLKDSKSKFNVEKINESSLKIVASELTYTFMYSIFSCLKKGKSGIRNIFNVVVAKDREGKYVIRTVGSNLKKLLAVGAGRIDFSSVYSDDINDVLSNFGIEAVFNVVSNEVHNIVRVDLSHSMLLADAMTREGIIHNINRGGIMKKRNSVLARASFETTLTHIIDASLYGHRENLKGAIENLVVGQKIQLA